KLCDTPNKIVQTPNPATHHNIVFPTPRCNGRCARYTAINAAPTPGAVRKIPNPHGPVFKISRAYTGKSATAPPSRTANKSSEIDPKIIFSLQMYRNPASTVFALIGSRFRGAEVVGIRKVPSVASKPAII